VTRIVVLRGTAANPWDLRAWADLDRDRFDVRVVVAPNNLYALDGLGLPSVPVRTVGGLLRHPLPTRAVGEHYLPKDLRRALAGADVVHAAELGTWFSDQAARHRPPGAKLVLTVWETLPFGDAYRNVRTRPYRRRVLAATDLFLATTQRARDALLLEGAPAERIRVTPPGVDLDRWAAARTPQPPADGRHVVLSAGRLVWEKGHQEVLRAVALLRRDDVRVLIVGAGPEAGRLRAHARELGVDLELRGFVPHAELVPLYAQASCLVLGSSPTWCWEEQFGMVLAEALAAHLPIVTTTSGAIPEVVGSDATLVAPGDHVGLARALADGPLAGAPAARRVPDPARLERLSAAAAARRLAEAYSAL
jgi:glycosyltransferase involved in cell wall biosynthesis